MRSTLVPLTAYDNRPSIRVRLAAWLLSLAVVALILAALISMGMLDRPPGGPGERFTSIRFAGTRDKAQDKVKSRAAPEKTRSLVQLPQPTLAPTPVPKIPPIKLIVLSKSDFAAADISNLSKQREGAAGSPAEAGSGGGAYGPGEGPGGAKLYNAEWYREPSHAELAGYLKSGAPPGAWAMIACKTIEHFHVENCMQLGESPPGSGLSRSLRLAAWQFLVRPPRIDGKPIIGAWVRIRFDFTGKPQAAEAGAREDN